MRYARRIIDNELDELFGQIPAIAIDGPKAVGKTTTAEQRVHGLLRLDAKSNLEAVQADPGLLLRRPRPLLIDEWQKVPEVWDVVRRAVDDDPTGRAIPACRKCFASPWCNDSLGCRANWPAAYASDDIAGTGDRFADGQHRRIAYR